MNVSDAVATRISTRAFNDTPLSERDIRDWLTAAQRAPSGGNVQPWRVIVVTGAEKDTVVQLAGKTLMANPAGEKTDRPIYPKDLGEPYMERRRAVARQMYEKLGIAYDDKPARNAWMAQNFTFFGAPVGVFFVIDDDMGHGQWAHTGMYMQTLALLAEERGWGTCMQECWAMLRTSLQAHFGLAETELIYCGMAVGVPDREHPVNTMRAERADLDDVADLRGF